MIGLCKCRLISDSRAMWKLWWLVYAVWCFYLSLDLILGFKAVLGLESFDLYFDFDDLAKRKVSKHVRPTNFKICQPSNFKICLVWVTLPIYQRNFGMYHWYSKVPEEHLELLIWELPVQRLIWEITHDCKVCSPPFSCFSTFHQYLSFGFYSL